MNIGQTLLNIGIMYLVSTLKGGAAATASALMSGQLVTAAKVTLGPGEVAVVSVQIESK